ncbi:MAG: peptidoglycan DD-metalloendopeptidase family protein, partial [Candidatus Moraniibacteriota bacterium]
MRFILLVLCVFANAAYALDQTETGFFYPTGKAQFDSGGGTWLGRDAAHESASDAQHYFDGFYHNGVDMMTRSLDAKVYAIADGTIYKRHCKDIAWGPGNCALFIKHKTYDGQEFTAVYGHLSKGSLPAGNEVDAGVSIGKTGPWSGGIHLHLGIFPGSTPPSTVEGVRGWGMMANSEWRNECEGNSTCTNTFTNPVAFIQTHFAYNPSTE